METNTAWSMDHFCVGVESVAYALTQAHEMIDDEFYPGYAAKNPALVGAFLQAAATPRHDHPLQGETLEGISGALNYIGDTLTAISNNMP